MAFIKLNFNVDVNKCLSEPWASLRLGRPKSGIKKLEKEMARLIAKRDDIENKIAEAEREGKIPTNEVSQWLRVVEILEGKVAEIEQDFQSIRCFSCYYCCSINRRAAEKLGEAKELMSRGDALDPIARDWSRPKSSIQELEKEMARLRVKRDDIKNQIDQAEREGRIPTNQVGQWLLEVATLEGQVSDIEKDFQSISCFSCHCCDQTQTQQAVDQVPIRELSNCCSIILRVAKKLGEVKELMDRADRLDPVAKVGRPETTVMLPMSHRPPVGIESYVKDIVGYIDGGEVNIIGVYGMGGVGKTTILESIQQHYSHSIFDPVIWVVATEECQLKSLQMDIAKRLGLQTLQDSDDERTRGHKLFSFLKDKNCLLLLDGIWEHVNLQLLGMAHSGTELGQQQPRKVVVFTTRSETVCADMKAEKKIKVQCLDPDQAWQLFEQNSDEDVLSSDAGIKFLAKELVKECAGLPLALVTVAGAMSGKKTWDSWKDALDKIRDKHEWTIHGRLKDSLVMYKAFKLSYDSLENDSIRECLLCCALWPEDYAICQISELIPAWIGCGIIHKFNVINEAFAEGYSHLESLMAASLLERCHKGFHYGGARVKMHDVIRDMALLMVSGSEGNKRKWIVKAGIELSDLPGQEEWKEAERASFVNSNLTSFQDYGASTFSKLSMLMLRYNNHLVNIPASLSESMPHLTYLDLSRCRITELPKEICSLIELQYLNLSFNPITRLPDEFGCLGNLEYLFLRGTSLKIVPNGTISNLSMLRWLDIAYIHPAPEWWGDELRRFKGRCQLSVGININATTDNIERLNMLPNVSIWELTLEGRNISILPNFDLGTAQWSCRVSDKLELLLIRNLGLDRLEFAAAVGRKSSFECLKILHLECLKLLEEISLNGVRFCFLRELCITRCPMLKDVSWFPQLKCLHLLQIDICSKMEELINEAGNSNPIPSSNIRYLSLWGMPNLNSIANRPLDFPFLEHLSVSECPKLKKLQFGKNRLKEIVGDTDWWNNLVWDDKSIKDSLTPCFRSH